jgi:hypothetical protein
MTNKSDQSGRRAHLLKRAAVENAAVIKEVTEKLASDVQALLEGQDRRAAEIAASLMARFAEQGVAPHIAKIYAIVGIELARSGDDKRGLTLDKSRPLDVQYAEYGVKEHYSFA